MRYEGEIYRPPGEWKSYLLQCTVGCSHNACTFCGMYKDKRYHVRPLSDILEDIDMAQAHYGDLRRVFLCDGDAIAMDTGDLLTILDKLRATFPSLERVTTYAGPKSTLAKSPEELKALADAGLTRAYLGVETGSDALLRQVGKGVSARQMLEAGLCLQAAGMELWAIVLLGLGGQAGSQAHIQETVTMMNAMAPRHLSAMTYTPVAGTPMYDAICRGEFRPLDGHGALLETRTLLSGLTVNPLHFTANHPSNYLPLKGGLPEDRDRLLSLVDGALAGEIPLEETRPRYL